MIRIFEAQINGEFGVLKAKKNCFKEIVKTATLLHSYEVPEIIALPIIDGNRDYLKWIEESCSP